VKIVIVDDEPDILSVLRDAFADQEIFLFSSADLALEYIKKNLPDIIISDVRMPGKINGLGLLQEVKNRWPGLPFIVISGYRSANGIPDIMGLGADALFYKPFHFSELVEAATRLTSGKK